MPLYPEQHPLTEPDQETLNAALRSPGMVIFKRVIEAKANLILTKAVEDAYLAKEGDALINNAQARIDDAQRYKTCLDVIAEMAKDEKHFEIRVSTVKPKQPTTK